MTPETLKSWIKSRRLSHQDAADLLAITLNVLHKNLYGATPIGAQTERIIELIDEAWDHG